MCDVCVSLSVHIVFGFNIFYLNIFMDYGETDSRICVEENSANNV